MNVRLDGYEEQTQTVRLEAGRTEVLSVSLQAAVPQTGQLVIRVSPFADYWIDGQKVGTNIGRVSAGTHDVRVQHPLFKAHEWKATRVQAGERTTLRHDFVAADAFGSLRVTVRGGWGQIHVDGQDTGKVSPNVVDQVAVGRRVVSLHSANGPVAGTERTVVIREGETVEVSYDLSGN